MVMMKHRAKYLYIGVASFNIYHANTQTHSRAHTADRLYNLDHRRQKLSYSSKHVHTIYVRSKENTLPLRVE